MSTAYCSITGRGSYGSVFNEVSHIIIDCTSQDWVVSNKRADSITRFVGFNYNDGILVEADVVGWDASTVRTGPRGKCRVILKLKNVVRSSGPAPFRPYGAIKIV